MSLTIETVTFDCTDPDALAGWWAQAVGGTVTPVMPGEFVLVALAAGAKLGFQRVDDPTPGKNRLHLDFSAADPAAEVARLIADGATETGRHNIGDFKWVVLADPDGNAFCIAG
jgi:hypothetical protein